MKLRRIRIRLRCLCFVAVTPLAASCEGAPGPEILWDEWGVPHVYASDYEGLFHAFGWAQMRSHGEQILRMYADARGRSAEYFGRDRLESDIFVQTMGVPERAVSWLEDQTPGMQRQLAAFADGMNAWAESHPDDLSQEARRVLPVEATDPLAHLQFAIHLSVVAFSARPQIDAWQRPGSNAYAISPARSASGNSMLLINPHSPWFGVFLFYESHLVGADLDIYGIGLLGLPFHAMAFNRNLGWAHTFSTNDAADLYELELSDGGYVWNGSIRPFDIETRTLRVRTAEGTMEDQAIEIRRSVHGPVVAERDGKVVALRIAGLDRPGVFEQYMNMSKAEDLQEFQTAVSTLQMPMFNIVYADRHGEIYYLYNGLHPLRGNESRDFWAGVVPGTSDETLWDEYLPFERLPGYSNPPGGFIQNSNDPPWTSTFPPVLDPGGFPSYVAPRFMSYRAQRAVKQIESLDSITWEQLLEMTSSTRLEMADRLLPELLAAAAGSADPRVAEAARILEAWDRETRPESRGAVLFAEWVSTASRELGSGLFAEPWNPDEPLSTPRGLANPAAAAEALSRAAADVRERYGAIDVPWGDVYRIRFGEKDLPAFVGPDDLGAFNAGFFQPGEDGTRSLVSATAYVAVVEFGDEIRAMGILPYGNTTDRKSPHFGDQVELFSSGRLRQIWFQRADVEAHTEERESPDRR